MADLIRVGGLWKSKTKAGEFYLSGKFGQVKVLVFPVKEKRSENSPDYSLCIAAVEEESTSGGGGGGDAYPPPQEEDRDPFGGA